MKIAISRHWRTPRGPPAATPNSQPPPHTLQASISPSFSSSKWVTLSPILLTFVLILVFVGFNRWSYYFDKNKNYFDVLICWLCLKACQGWVHAWAVHAWACKLELEMIDLDFGTWFLWSLALVMDIMMFLLRLGEFKCKNKLVIS